MYVTHSDVCGGRDRRPSRCAGAGGIRQRWLRPWATALAILAGPASSDQSLALNQRMLPMAPKQVTVLSHLGDTNYVTGNIIQARNVNAQWNHSGRFRL